MKKTNLKILTKTEKQIAADEFSLVLDGSSGNFGIGTISPDSELHVNGSVKVEGSLNLTSNNVTAVDCTTFKSGGRICDSV